MSQHEIKHAPGFYLHMSGGGEGCDYTIGCGHKLMRLDANTLEKARVAAMREWHDHGAEGPDGGCTEMHILTVAHVEDLAGLMSADRERRNAEKAAAALASKRAELARLKRELGEA